MRPDGNLAAIRRRTPWEGVDLGIALAQRWFLPLWGLWWLTALPVVGITAFWLADSPGWAILIVWWLKPLYEPPLLYWLSRRLFGEPLSLRAILRQWRRVWLPRLPANLLWRRLSPHRSLLMPVSHLEGGNGKADPRRNVLVGNQSASGWLTLIGVHVESILALGMLLLVLFVIPDELRGAGVLALIGQESATMLWWSNAGSLLAMSLMAPFYVAGGFGLYLSRRTELEAWDLELTFRSLAPRLQRGARAAAVLLAAGWLVMLTLPAPVRAATDLDPERVRAEIQSVLSDKDFGERREVTRWRYVGETDEPKAVEATEEPAWFGALAELVRLSFWIGAALLLAYVIWRIVALLRDWAPAHRPRPDRSRPTIIMGLPVTPHSLPRDIAAALRDLVDAGESRAALSLLYRATLTALIHRHRLHIPSSATEGECLALVREQRPDPESGFFEQLTGAWVQTAYGGQPTAAVQLLALGREWQRLFGAGNELA